MYSKHTQSWEPCFALLSTVRWRSKALAESQCLERPALIFRWTDLHLTPQYLTKAFVPPWLLKVESEAAEWWILPSVSVFTFSSFRGEESLLDNFKYRPESRDKVTWHTHVNYSPFFKTFGFSDTKHIFKAVKSRSGILIVIDVVGKSFFGHVIFQFWFCSLLFFLPSVWIWVTGFCFFLNVTQVSVLAAPCSFFDIFSIRFNIHWHVPL